MADFLDGYARVMEVVRAQHKERTGREIGAASWLARQLGCTRQSIDNYGKKRYRKAQSGFPRRYAAKLMKITGLSEDEIWPGVTIPVNFPSEVWDGMSGIQKRTDAPMSAVAVELVRIGLKSNGEK